MKYQLHRLIHFLVTWTAPARLVAAIPAVILPTVVAAQAVPIQSAPYNLALDTSTPSALVMHVDNPNFDTDVLTPLRASQAKAEADREAALAAAADAAAHAAVKASAPTGDAALAGLRYCEAGGDYTRNSGNGYYGAYQYAIGSWANFGGYARADLAPASVQDAKVRADVAVRGWAPWPACARKLGLL